METQSSKSQNMREFRRLRAVELFESGMKQVDIARVPGVTKGAVSQWLSAYREKGLDALRYRKIVKKPCRLSDEQKNELRDLLVQGPEHFGYMGNVWTLPREGDAASVSQQSWQRLRSGENEPKMTFLANGLLQISLQADLKAGSKG